MSWRAAWLCVLGMVSLVSCGPPQKLKSPHSIGVSAVYQVEFEPAPNDSQYELIRVPITIFILDDTQQTFSSSRSFDEIVVAHRRANEIWEPAGIRFDVKKVVRGTIPIALTANIIRWQVDDFFEGYDQLPREFQRKTAVTGFFVQTVRGPNGVASAEHMAYFIADEPLTDDGRVVAHELGHILGLDHIDNAQRLMHSGTNGTVLTSQEIAVARKTAENLTK